MTDKEIIKALECCPLPGGCGVCPYNNGDLTDCDARICRDTLRLITCQKSQIEDLYAALDDRIERIKELEAEVERLNHCVKTEDEVRAIMKTQMSSVVREVTAEQFDTATKIAKTAAIREFAERLKEESEVYCSAPNGASETVLAVSCDDIDAIVKEMTEDTDND